MRFTEVKEAPPKLITRTPKVRPKLSPEVLRRALPKKVYVPAAKAVKTIMVPRNKAVQISRREIIRVPAGTRISTPRGGSYLADRPLRVVVPAGTRVTLPLPSEAVSIPREQAAVTTVVTPTAAKAVAPRVVTPTAKATASKTATASAKTASTAFDWKWLAIAGLGLAALAGWGRRPHEGK